MSIDYTAVPKRNRAYLEKLWSDESDEVVTIDRSAIANRIKAEFPDMKRLTPAAPASDDPAGSSREGSNTRDTIIEFRWEVDGYIEVALFKTQVGIAHGFKGGSRKIETLERLFALLREEGLHIWDPQGDNFLPPG